jgi:hypothetical protein
MRKLLGWLQYEENAFVFFPDMLSFALFVASRGGGGRGKSNYDAMA